MRPASLVTRRPLSSVHGPGSCQGKSLGNMYCNNLKRKSEHLCIYSLNNLLVKTLYNFSVFTSFVFPNDLIWEVRLHGLNRNIWIHFCLTLEKRRPSQRLRWCQCHPNRENCGLLSEPAQALRPRVEYYSRRTGLFPCPERDSVAAAGWRLGDHWVCLPKGRFDFGERGMLHSLWWEFHLLSENLPWATLAVGF